MRDMADGERRKREIDQGKQDGEARRRDGGWAKVGVRFAVRSRQPKGSGRSTKDTRGKADAGPRLSFCHSGPNDPRLKEV